MPLSEYQKKLLNMVAENEQLRWRVAELEAQLAEEKTLASVLNTLVNDIEPMLESCKKAMRGGSGWQPLLTENRPDPPADIYIRRTIAAALVDYYTDVGFEWLPVTQETP